MQSATSCDIVYDITWMQSVRSCDIVCDITWMQSVTSCDIVCNVTWMQSVTSRECSLRCDANPATWLSWRIQVKVSLEVTLGDVVMVKHWRRSGTARSTAPMYKTLWRHRDGGVVRGAPVCRHDNISSGLLEWGRRKADPIGRRNKAGIWTAWWCSTDENFFWQRVRGCRVSRSSPWWTPRRCST